jgi:phosphoribosyl 1,2-cyclic phosphodiesterase
MHGLSVAVLCSGSSGNSILVSHEDSNVLIDAGLSCRELERRLSLFGTEPTQIESVLLTHEHTDHTRGVKRFCAEHKLPVYSTRGTLALTPLEGIETKTISAGSDFSLDELVVRPFKVRHLAAEPVAFSLSIDSVKVGIASDLGCVTPSVIEEMSGSSLMLVESNYDEKMLIAGDYPEFLKRAIKSDHGHLSNDDAGRLSLRSSSEKTERVVLVHLSKDNNTPERARETVEHEIKRLKHRPRIEVIEHGQSGGPYRLS